MLNAFVKNGAAIEVPEARKNIPNIKKIAAKCRESQIPVIYANHSFRSDRLDKGLMFDFWPNLESGCLCQGSSDAEVYGELEPETNDIIVRKYRYSAFFNTELDTILRKLKKNSLIITGTVTEFCCESTARDAFFRDYKVFFISDANASVSELAQRASLQTIARGFGQVLSTDEILANFEANQ